jgi:hypothetical protein
MRKNNADKGKTARTNESAQKNNAKKTDKREGTRKNATNEETRKNNADKGKNARTNESAQKKTTPTLGQTGGHTKKREDERTSTRTNESARGQTNERERTSFHPIRIF